MQATIRQYISEKIFSEPHLDAAIQHAVDQFDWDAAVREAVFAELRRMIASAAARATTDVLYPGGRERPEVVAQVEAALTAALDRRAKR